MVQNVFIDHRHEAAFRQDGYLVLDLLSAADIAELQHAFTAVEAQHTYDFIASVVLGDVAMRHSIHHHVSPVFVRSLLPVLNGYKCVLANFVAKRAAAQNGKFPLHQDPTFVAEEDHVGLSIWCPLVDVDKHNGCLGMLPGSHRLNNLHRPPGMMSYPDLAKTIESEYLHYIPMKAGQAVFMNTRTIHGSPPNLSGAMRPVAAGVAIPAHMPLLCCYVDEAADPKTTNVFQVPDNFYLSHMMLTQPQQGTLCKTVPRQVEPLLLENYSKG